MALEEETVTMTDRKQINVKIRSDKADKWDEYQQENPEYSSMTDLIRQSVSKEIAGNSDSPTSSTSPEVGKDMAEMKDNMKELTRTVEMLSDTVSELRGDVRNQTPSDKHLRGEIFAALPIEGLGETPEEIAKRLGEPINSDVVSRVLQDLHKEVGSVTQGIGAEEGEIFYKKEE